MHVIVNEKKKVVVLNVLVLLFLTHGILYFIAPQDIYNISSSIRYLKYIIVMIVWVVLIKETKLISILAYASISSLAVIINIVAVGDSLDLVFMLNHVIPFGIYFLYDGLSKYLSINKLAMATYCVLSLVGYFEYFFFQRFVRFADQGYRIISIFVNPNNLGLVIILLSVYIIGAKVFSKNIYNVVLYLNSTALIFMSGSRNSLLIFTIISIMWLVRCLTEKIFMKQRKIKLLALQVTLLFVLILVIVTIFRADDILVYINDKILSARTFSTKDVFQGRFLQLSQFINSASKNFLFPNHASYTYVDNLYIHLWTNFGVIVMVLFIVVNLYMLFKTCLDRTRYMQFTMLSILLLAGFAENFIYLWPLGYFYWYLVADIFKVHHSKMKGYMRG